MVSCFKIRNDSKNLTTVQGVHIHCRKIKKETAEGFSIHEKSLLLS